MTQPRKKVNAAYQAAVDKFVVASDQHNGDAQKWLASFLKQLDWSSLKDPWLWGFRSDEPAKLPSKLQIALLKLCIDLMVRLRDHRDGDECPDRGSIEYRINIDIGSVVYCIAIDLFHSPLPFSERDICEILESTRHDCGHGGDVAPPFNLALAYARKHRLSPKLQKAVNVYMDRMKRLQTRVVFELKRKAELLFSLDETFSKKPCWSERFRKGLGDLPALEQESWRKMVLQMDAVEFGRNLKPWQAKAPQFITSIGAEQILTRLSQWWPNPQKMSVCPLQTGGSYLLQHFVWLLGVIAQEEQHAKRADALVVQLSKLDWKPRERAQKVMVAAAQYLVQRPPKVAWTALQRLNTWSESVDKKAGYTGSSILKMLKKYSEKHKLSPKL